MKKKEASVAKAKKKSSPAKAKKSAKKPAAKKASPSKSKATPKKSAAKKPAGKKSTAKNSNENSKSKGSPKSNANLSNFAKKTAKMDWENFLTPLDDRLIVQTSAGEKMTAGGLYIPDTAAVSGNFQGQVLVAGRGHRDEKGRFRPMDVRKGDTVLFSEFSGAKLSLQGQDVIILRESEILGIVDQK